MDFSGVIIEESLSDTGILRSIKIVDTKIVNVTDKHETPWLKQWTMHTVSVSMQDAEDVAAKLANALDVEHIGNWYADFKNYRFHYVIFPGKIFKLDKKIKADWDSMQKYALSIGLPEHQTLAFEGIDEMERESRE